ncbi:glycosyltransferase [Polymorphospora lycopeni]|uniref:Nucleotide disphospho-sugar-binding domain-containing protein n=1 Tax=Polymorphospora lycopeni TaxID=3140240 RepID=A0ABV5CXW5_9ACTN
MRILLTCQPITSHLVPALVPLARAAAAAGHQVAVATAGSMADDLRRHGVAHLPLPRVPGLAELRTDPALADEFGLPKVLMAPGSRTVEPVVARQIARAYAGPVAGRFAADLLAAAPDWRPDVIVREPAEFGGYLAAERLGIPHATVDIAPYALTELPVVHDAVNAQRVTLGLPPVDDPRHPHRHLLAALLPPRWYPPDLRLPTTRHYRVPVPGEEPAPAGDPGVAGAHDRPLVLASLGSLALTLPGMADLLPVIVRALGALPGRAVVTLGGQAQLAGAIGPVPENVTVVPYVAQAEVLARCDLFVTHAGYSAIREAVAAGVPMVALPVVADQPANAARVAELGLGRALPIEDLTVEATARACSAVLADPGYRSRVAALRDELWALPDLTRLVHDLTTLTRSSAPARNTGTVRR